MPLCSLVGPGRLKSRETFLDGVRTAGRRRDRETPPGRLGRRGKGPRASDEHRPRVLGNVREQTEVVASTNTSKLGESPNWPNMSDFMRFSESLSLLKVFGDFPRIEPRLFAHEHSVTQRLRSLHQTRHCSGASCPAQRGHVNARGVQRRCPSHPCARFKHP